MTLKCPRCGSERLSCVEVEHPGGHAPIQVFVYRCAECAEEVRVHPVTGVMLWHKNGRAIRPDITPPDRAQPSAQT